MSMVDTDGPPIIMSASVSRYLGRGNRVLLQHRHDRAI
jgi:hypothetical protein